MNRRTATLLPLSVALLLAALPSVAGAQTTPAPSSAPAPAPSGGTTTPATTPIPATVAPDTEKPRTPADVPEDYRVDIGDLVSVNVTRHDDVCRTLRIPADGRLRLPRLEKAIAAKGKTCSELADLIAERLRDEGKLVLRPGQVTVTVVEMRVRRIYVRGNAAPRNGDFDLKPGWRITELVAVLGGVQNPERITARLFNPDRPKPVPVNLNAALTKPDSAENVALLEGDTLTLELPHNKRFYVKGEGPRGAFELDERFVYHCRQSERGRTGLPLARRRCLAPQSGGSTVTPTEPLPRQVACPLASGGAVCGAWTRALYFPFGDNRLCDCGKCCPLNCTT